MSGCSAGMSVPMPARVGMNGTLLVSACRAQMSVCSLYSSMPTSPACTAARNLGARPRPSKLTSPEMTRPTQPPATSQSTAMPCTIATTVRSRARRRTRARTNAIGVEFIDSPPMATVAPSGTSAAASSMLRSFTSTPPWILVRMLAGTCAERTLAALYPIKRLAEFSPSARPAAAARTDR